MYSHFQVAGYNITIDPEFQNERLGHTEELKKQLAMLFFESQNKKNKKIISILAKLIEKYPRAVQLKNFLTVAYTTHGNYQKANEINNQIVAEHPDYLFGKLNLANSFIDAGKPEKVPEVLGMAMELKDLYPERDLFHLSELTSFYKIAIRYYAVIEDTETAETKLRVLKEIAPDHPDTESAESFLFFHRTKQGLERWKNLDLKRIRVESAKFAPTSKLKTPPVFNHPEINNLYKYGIAIPHEKLRQILALNRETVIADLENILVDAVERYQYFLKTADGEESVIFPLHAICLLAELKSESSLATILNFLESDPEVLNFWLGDHLTDTIWMQLLLLSQNQSNLLKQFLLKSGISTSSKAAVSKALAQTAIHHPQKRSEVATIHEETFNCCVNASLKDNIIDSDFLGLAISNVIDCGFTQLLPVIKKLFDKEYVNVDMNGTYDEVEKLLTAPSQRGEKNKIENIFEFYETVLSTWAGYSKDSSYSKFDDYEDYEALQSTTSNKIGRNDPCPCGSGKKYKKCCMYI